MPEHDGPDMWEDIAEKSGAQGEPQLDNKFKAQATQQCCPKKKGRKARQE